MTHPWSAFLDLLLPPRCADCGVRRPADDSTCRPDDGLCLRCRERLPWLPDHQTGPSVPALSDCVAAVAFAGDAERWIRRFKYPPRGLAGLDPGPGAVIRELAREVARRAPGPPPNLVVPVPLHPRKLRARAFNPAALIAREIARTRKARFAPRALSRVRDTESQTGLDRRARARNVAGAFHARGPAPRDIWLVDDVVTTGATLAEAARELRRAGARRVVGVCLAWTRRSPRADPG